MTQGVLSKAGVLATATWATAPQTNATLAGRVPLRSETLTANYALYRSQALGQASQHRLQKGFRAAQGQLVFDLDLASKISLLDVVFMRALGTGSGTYEMSDTLPMFAAHIQKGANLHSYGPLKVTRMAITHRRDEIAQLAVDVIGRTVYRQAASLVAAAPAADPCLWSHLTVRVADKADALVAGDEIDVEELELVIENPIDQTGGSASDDLVEPLRDGFRTGRLRLNLTRAGGNWATWKEANTPLQADLVWNTGTNSFTVGVFTCYVASGGDVPVSGPQVLKDTIELEITSGANTLGNFSGKAGDMVYAQYV